VRVQLEHKHPVNIIGVDGTWRRSCILLDDSASGAKLEVEESTDALRAQEFFLLLSSTGLAFRRCELVWVSGPHVGVPFITEKTKGKGHLVSLRKSVFSNRYAPLVCGLSRAVASHLGQCFEPFKRSEHIRVNRKIIFTPRYAEKIPSPFTG
jgi:hypothetical protein